MHSVKGLTRSTSTDKYDGSYDVEIFLNKLIDNATENESVQQLK